MPAHRCSRLTLPHLCYLPCPQGASQLDNAATNALSGSLRDIRRCLSLDINSVMGGVAGHQGSPGVIGSPTQHSGGLPTAPTGLLAGSRLSRDSQLLDMVSSGPATAPAASGSLPPCAPAFNSASWLSMLANAGAGGGGAGAAAALPHSSSGMLMQHSGPLPVLGSPMPAGPSMDAGDAGMLGAAFLSDFSGIGGASAEAHTSAAMLPMGAAAAGGGVQHSGFFG
jgi:hypothetical protein